MNDVLLKTGESTTQIDHIVISQSGLFVIETKNYKGWIHGHEKSDYWTQTIYKQRTRFRNPVKQNGSHVYLLRKILSAYPEVDFWPIVVFTGSAKLKNVFSRAPVIYSNRLIRTIEEINQDPKLSKGQMQRIGDTLNKYRLKGRKAYRNHTKRVKKKIGENRKNPSALRCPVCGNYLIKRHGKFGEFYGCTSYPRCTYTENIQRISI